MTRTELGQYDNRGLVTFTYPLFGWFIRAQGWERVGEPPAAHKYVLLGAPHTSNWDFAFVLGYMDAHPLRFKWLAKKDLFPWPFERLHRTLGGIPVDRSRRTNLVDQVIEAFNTSDDLILLIPPEGTRGYRDYWKSGFYHIALGANVPVVLGFLDYARKQVGIGPTLHLSGDVDADMAQIRRFYADKTGKYPENANPIRLRQQMESRA